MGGPERIQPGHGRDIRDRGRYPWARGMGLGVLVCTGWAQCKLILTPPYGAAPQPRSPQPPQFKLMR
jgi:hypothetical protein